VWFEALTNTGPKPNMTMKQFADRTRAIAKTKYGVASKEDKGVDSAWKAVGL
jgi:Zn-dependent metalloprotease